MFRAFLCWRQVHHCSVADWTGALHHKDPTNSGWFFVCCGGLAALFVLKAWGSRKFFLRLDEAGKSRVESWQ
jgi:hypothetical protein